MKQIFVTHAAILLTFPVSHASAQEAADAAGSVVPMFWKSPEPLDPEKAYTLTEPGGHSIQAQADAQNRLWWLGKPGATGGLQLKTLDTGAARQRVKVERLGDEQISVTIDGKPFTILNFKKGESRPYLYPVIGPTGDPVTRDYPMKQTDEEKARKYQDHPHHRSFWTAHGEVRSSDKPDEKIDYWGTERTTEVDGKPKVAYRGGNAGQQRVTKIVRIASGPVFGLIEAQVEWVTSEGKRQLSDTRTYRFFGGSPEQRVVDYELALHFDDFDVTFGDTKEGGLIALRIPYSLTEKPGEGRMTNAKGGKGAGECWGQPAEWCDYVGPVNKSVVGIAIFDAPSNFRHPTRWHIRDYGLYTANPFMAQDVDKTNEDSSHTWKKGESVTFSYRVIFHKGDTAQAGIAAQYAAYARPSIPSIGK